MNKLSVYCVHQITGLTYEEVVTYYKDVVLFLTEVGYTVFHPMTGKSYLMNATKDNAEGYSAPTSTFHAIKERDQWMVRNSDVIFADLTGCPFVSVGCTSEIAWGDLLGKHVVVVMEKGNPHDHAFIREMADIIFDNTADAREYLKKFITQEI